jgi:tetratricopeptide (TPR) repeat protein
MWEVGMKRGMTALIVALFFMFTFSLGVAETVSSLDLISHGDAAYKKFDNKAALEFFKKALETEPKNYEAAWKSARAYVDVGEKLSDTKERRAYYEKGYDCAQKAVAINPDGSKGHLFLSIAIGRVALDAGAKERVRLSKEVKSEVDKALAIDPQDDVAWHVLGRWHRRLSTLSWIEKNFANMFLGGVPKEASMENAVDCFKRAIQLNPSHINHHLELGITHEKMGKKDLAVAAYSKVLELPIRDADDEDHKKEAEERLKKMGKPVFRQSRYNSPLVTLK